MEYSTNSNTVVSDTPIKITWKDWIQLDDYQKEDKCFLIADVPSSTYDDSVSISNPSNKIIYNAVDAISTIANPSNKIIYIHKTNCPNCGSLLDGNENTPYVKCVSCGAKIWSEREVKV